MTEKKRIRLLTNRDSFGWEAIELDEHGTFFWIADEPTIGCAFPVGIDFVSDKFRECGRTFDRKRLPENAKTTCPYTGKSLLHLIAE